MIPFFTLIEVYTYLLCDHLFTLVKQLKLTEQKLTKRRLQVFFCYKAVVEDFYFLWGLVILELFSLIV